MKVIVYTAADKSKSKDIELRDGLTQKQILSRINQKISKWYYYEIQN